MAIECLDSSEQLSVISTAYQNLRAVLDGQHQQRQRPTFELFLLQLFDLHFGHFRPQFLWIDKTRRTWKMMRINDPLPHDERLRECGWMGGRWSRRNGNNSTIGRYHPIMCLYFYWIVRVVHSHFHACRVHTLTLSILIYLVFNSKSMWEECVCIHGFMNVSLMQSSHEIHNEEMQNQITRHKVDEGAFRRHAFEFFGVCWICLDSQIGYG